MKKLISYCLLFGLGILFFTTCKKYPEGPAFSLRSKEARFMGDWEVELFLVDGNDSTSKLTCNRYSFYKKESNRDINSSLCTGVDGDWDFENHKKNIRIKIFYDAVYVAPFPPTDSGVLPLYSNLSWEIQRLTNDRVWLKTNVNNKEYYIKFNKMDK